MTSYRVAAIFAATLLHSVAYFSGIKRNDGKGNYPLAADCSRLEQFRSGIFSYVARIRDRRFVLERGIAFAFAFFDNAGGESRFGTLPDGRSVESGPKIPWAWAIAEAFKIDRGFIGPVESVLHQVPYGMQSGWSRLGGFAVERAARLSGGR